MTDYYSAPEEHSGDVGGDAGAARPEGWNSAPSTGPVQPATALGQDRAAFPPPEPPASHPARADAPYVATTQGQPQPALYAHKNEILYAFGGIFFPGLVLLLMGKKGRGITILCCWAVSLLLLIVFIGVFFLIGTVIWSVVECYLEAKKQNQAHGYAS